jgi:hypothetical protein
VKRDAEFALLSHLHDDLIHDFVNEYEREKFIDELAI